MAHIIMPCGLVMYANLICRWKSAEWLALGQVPERKSCGGFSVEILQRRLAVGAASSIKDVLQDGSWRVSASKSVVDSRIAYTIEMQETPPKWRVKVHHPYHHATKSDVENPGKRRGITSGSNQILRMCDHWGLQLMDIQSSIIVHSWRVEVGIHRNNFCFLLPSSSNHTSEGHWNPIWRQVIDRAGTRPCKSHYNRTWLRCFAWCPGSSECPLIHPYKINYFELFQIWVQ